MPPPYDEPIPIQRRGKIYHPHNWPLAMEKLKTTQFDFIYL